MRWGIALEGGGVRCAAQAGAVSALLEAGLWPTAFAGCGAGAWVAALCAMEKTPRALREAVEQIARAPFLTPWGVRSRPVGRTLREQLRPQSLFELPLGFAAPAVDLDTGTVHVFSSKLPLSFDPRPWSRQISLAGAARAALGAPGVLPPLIWRARALSGGGQLRGLLPQLLRALGMDRVVLIRVLDAGCARAERKKAAMAICAPALISSAAPGADLVLNIGEYGRGAGVLDLRCGPALFEQGAGAARRALPTLRALIAAPTGNLVAFPGHREPLA